MKAAVFVEPGKVEVKEVQIYGGLEVLPTVNLVH